ncbi:TonB-dependent receptor plug domain-containing protein [Hyphomonas atlantica corrig.]|uniref:TonB-dependent receptor plug domain-containing protein n=1 Tax=Hyphomonas atlantica TaxID=1280948 RepID=UPI00235740E1|nr:TonB-dependent receptor [Hyphomonas atlantica]
MKLRLLAALSTCLCTHALAQAPSDAPIIYESDYFERFVPQTALDMVERVPGFNLDQGEDRRGLAGAAGNVLIDGRVPVVKGQSIRGFLRRIPASTVERLELIRGSGTSASNAQTVRVNIVRATEGGSGVWRTTFDYAEDDRISPNVDASWTGRVGRVEYRVSGDYRKSHDPRTGTELIFDEAGVLDERETEQRVRDDDRIGVSGEITIPFETSELLLVGAFNTRDEKASETARIFSALGVSDDLELVLSEQENESRELSATYSQHIAGWDSELSALMLFEQTEDRQAGIDFDTGGGFDSRTVEVEKLEEAEAILRTQAARGLRNGTIAIEGELAFNTLKQSLRLTEDEGDGPLLVDLPGANTTVEESRGEFGATRAWEIATNWSIEAGIAFEVSRLSNEGDFSDERDLSFWKPSIQVTRKLGEQNQLRFRIYRDVDQLDFEDFAAGVELDNEDVVAGNSDLRPETSWRAEFVADWRFGEGALEISVFGWDVEYAQDFALIETENDRFDTQRNIGDGTIYGLNARAETPIKFVPGSTLAIGGHWQNSEVEDPLTGNTRKQSGTPDTNFEFEFRQDIESHAFAWGVDFERETQAPEFRFDRVTESQNQDRARLWVETTAFGNFKIRLAADNVTGSRQTRDRIRFDPDRLGALRQFEHRERDPGTGFSLRLQAAF